VPSGGSPASLRGCIASITTLITNRGEDAAKQYLVFILSEMMCCLDWSTQGPHGLGVNRPEIKLSIVIPANAGIQGYQLDAGLHRHDGLFFRCLH
jgi:hypothetical protein